MIGEVKTVSNFRGIIGEYRGLSRIQVYPSEFGDHAGWNQIVLDWHAPQSHGLETYLIQTNTILKMISETPSDSVCVPQVNGCGLIIRW